jgi:hypothetical protein
MFFFFFNSINNKKYVLLTFLNDTSFLKADLYETPTIQFVENLCPNEFELLQKNKKN